MITFWKMKNYRETDLLYQSLGLGRGLLERDMGEFWGDGIILYVDCNYGYISICVCQKSHDCVLKVRILLYVNYIL